MEKYLAIPENRARKNRKDREYRLRIKNGGRT